MFAFGLPPRLVVALGIAEYLVVGILATLTGIAGGMLIVAWMIGSLFPDTFPELGMVTSLAPASIAAAAVARVAAIALGPLFTLRRLRRMDVPATLRVVE